MSSTVEKFEVWAIVEIMGHKKFAGYVTEQALGGTSFVRIDVPEIVLESRTLPAFSKLFGAGSIYCISPCTEETAKAFAAELRSEAFALYEAPRLPAPARSRPVRASDLQEDDDQDDDQDDDDMYDAVDEDYGP